MDKNWDLLLSKFRRLGGIAENVCQKQGDFGRGIFPNNPNLRSRIFTPSKLMIKKEDICLVNNKLRIKKDKEYNNEIRDFFNYYQDYFSWGKGGKEKTESFERGLSLFSSDLKKLIKESFLVDIEERHKGNWNSVIKEQFLNSRVVKLGNYAYVAPIWELVNHEVNSFPYISSFNGISTPNYVPRKSELTLSYGYKSSIGRVFNYGFFCEESIVFSLPFSVDLKDITFKLICKGLELNNDKIQYKSFDRKFVIDGLPIATVNKPLFVKNYFEKIIDLTDLKDVPQDFLSKIVSINYLRRKEILDELKLIDNVSSRMISRAINYEMGLISHV